MAFLKLGFGVAQAAARVYASLTPEEQAQVVIFGGNYGDAGAIDLFDVLLLFSKSLRDFENNNIHRIAWSPAGRTAFIKRLKQWIG